jgi:regulator of protease activity HflC (stomatin/prohibitin superfamily)
MTDDPAQYAGTDAPAGQAFVQITEAVAGPVEAGEVIERADEQGRVPVVVRIHRQPPINPVWILVAIGLAASGLFLPLFEALKAIIIVAAIAVLIFGIASRLFMRIPPGTVGLTARASRFDSVREAGSHFVNPFLALTHVVTTRELAFDVPVAAVRSSDGVNVNVDLVLTLGIEDPVKFAYTITTNDLDQFIHATSQEAVRLLVRGIEALSALDLGSAEATMLRQAIDEKLQAYGVRVRNVAFTRVMLPQALTASLEARRLASIQLAEEKETYALEERRMNDRASLMALEQESRRAALELESQAEALRLAKLDERIRAYPTAAQYDLDTQRLRVARELAGNTRAVVSMGGNDLVSSLLTVQQANGPLDPAATPAPVSRAASPTPPVTTPPPEAAAEPGAQGRAAVRRRASG